jgi:hypothetical protein
MRKVIPLRIYFQYNWIGPFTMNVIHNMGLVILYAGINNLVLPSVVKVNKDF